MPIEIVEGWTGPVDVRLDADGSPVDLAGMTVALVLHDAYGSTVLTTGAIFLSSSTGWKVTYSPLTTGDLVAARGPYGAHFKVTDTGGKIVFFPSAKADPWFVYSQ